MAKELLLEVGTEEIPSQYLSQALELMEELASRILTENRLPHQKIASYATPRRLVLYVGGLPERQSATGREIQGPPRSVAFDDRGYPTPAAQGFARIHGISPKDLTVKKTDRGEYVFAIVQEKRLATADLLKELLPHYLASLSFPKTMRWGDGKTRFVRPIRWILALSAGRVIPFVYAGIKSGNRSYGHPLLSPAGFSVRDFKSYLKEARRHYVIVDQSERKALIQRRVSSLARSKGGIVEEDEELLERNTFMVEYPVVLRGHFEERFLQLPQEVLVSVMREQQGYFSVHRTDGGLLPYFICVSDIKAKTKAVLAGHERVLKARFEDARFYFEEDQRIPLEQRVEGLRGVIFHDQLGTLYDKMQRLTTLGVYLAERLEPSSAPALRRAALLCKTDLLTGMVREFPKLQGVIGREYARLQGEAEEVSRAIFEHYLPRTGGDPWMPKTVVSKFLAVADKIDTISGCFGIGLVPRGSEDPYGLRRQGQGLVRILLDGIFLKLPLRDLVRTALSLFKEKVSENPDRYTNEVVNFLKERLESFLKTRATAGKDQEVGAPWFSHGSYRSDLVDAVLSHQFDNIAEAYRRVVALVIFHRRPEFEPLMVAYKRAARIVPKDFVEAVRTDLFKERAEHELFADLQKAEEMIKPFLEKHQHEDLLKLLATLKDPIDAFFAKVYVMDQDTAIRNNRLALLKRVCDLFGQFADFSKIVVETKQV